MARGPDVGDDRNAVRREVRVSYIERVCQWAIDSGQREKTNPASGPKRQIDMPPPTHATLLPVDEVAGELAKIDALN